MQRMVFATKAAVYRDGDTYVYSVDTHECARVFA